MLDDPSDRHVRRGQQTDGGLSPRNAYERRRCDRPVLSEPLDERWALVLGLKIGLYRSRDRHVPILALLQQPVPNASSAIVCPDPCRQLAADAAKRHSRAPATNGRTSLTAGLRDLLPCGDVAAALSCER